jgi:peroxiredoxin
VTELGQLREHWQEILDRRVDVVAVSVDPPEISEKLRGKIGVGIRFVSDERGTLMDDLHVRHRNAMPPRLISGRPSDGKRDLFLSTTFLLDEVGVIRWVYRPDTYRVRAPARELLRAIDALA